MFRCLSLSLCLVCAFLITSGRADERIPKSWKAGAAKIIITPDKPMWLSGYSSRDRSAESKVHDRCLLRVVVSAKATR